MHLLYSVKMHTKSQRNDISNPDICSEKSSIMFAEFR